MGLSGWNSSKKLKLVIDSSKVDEDLTNFPINITLSSGTGQTGFDTTPVFDELATVSGTKKIAITTTVSGIETELYVEIERWDWENEEANLWVKVPTVSSGTNTELFLYYDSTHEDNTTYIGDTGNSAAQNVWDSNFKAVYHMAQDPNGDVADSIKDSTSNINHGTPVGAMTSADLVNGKIGKAIDFDAANDRLATASADDALNITTTLTLEAIINPTYTLDSNLTMSRGICGRQHIPNAIQDSYGFFINSDGKLQLGSHGGNVQSTKASWILNTFYYVVGTYNSSGLVGNLFVDETPEVLTVDSLDSMAGAINSFSIAANEGTAGNLFPGIIDEVRVSNIIRSDAWIKATYHSNWNDFVTFSEEEEGITFVFTNPIPALLSTVYGTTKQLCLTTTISGQESEYVYDADFYDVYDEQVGTTVSGINSGNQAESNAYLSTPSGIDYSWYMTATTSGEGNTSPTYTFHNRFLYEGYVTENNNPVSRRVNLYYRNTGELIDTTTSSGSNGYYKLSAVNNDTHFIVTFDDEAGEDYNALILDKLLPVETE